MSDKTESTTIEDWEKREAVRSAATHLLGLTQDLFDRLPGISVDPTQAELRDVYLIAGNLMQVRSQLIAAIERARRIVRESTNLMNNVPQCDWRYEQGHVAAANWILNAIEGR